MLAATKRLAATRRKVSTPELTAPSLVNRRQPVAGPPYSPMSDIIVVIEPHSPGSPSYSQDIASISSRQYLHLSEETSPQKHAPNPGPLLREEQAYPMVKSQREILQRTIDDLAAMLAPIRRMPPEVLLQIFLSYISMDHLDSLPRNSFSDVNYAPWLLSQVCHSWREIIFSSSPCWSKLIIRGNGGFRSTSSYNAAFYLISQHLFHSKDQPLHLDIAIDYMLDRCCPELFDLLLLYRERWRIIHYSIDDFKSTKDMVDRLFYSANASSSFQRLSVIRSSSHSLSQALHLQREFLGEEPPWPKDFPWHNLNHLALFHIHEHHMLSILPHLQSLQTLELNMVKPYGGRPSSDIRATLPSLETLDVRMGYIAVVNAITAPSLCHLIIRRPDEDWREPHTDLHSFISMILRSDCSITAFQGALVTSKPNLYSLLAAMPNLIGLDMHINPFDLSDQPRTALDDQAHFSDLATALRARDHDGNFTICPLLTRIQLHDKLGFGKEREVDTLVEFLELRCADRGRGQRLLSAAVEMNYKWRGREYMRRLQALQARGLDLDVSLVLPYH